MAVPPGDERTWVADLAGELRGLGPRLLVHFASEERSGPDGADDPEGRQENRRVEIVIGKNP